MNGVGRSWELINLNEQIPKFSTSDNFLHHSSLQRYETNILNVTSILRRDPIKKSQCILCANDHLECQKRQGKTCQTSAVQKQKSYDQHKKCWTKSRNHNSRKKMSTCRIKLTAIIKKKIWLPLGTFCKAPSRTKSCTGNSSS